MIFRLVNEARMQQVRDLWAYSFEKPEEPFFQYYFKEYCGKNNMVVGGFEEVNGWERLRTMLHINPYRMRLRGQELLVPYLVGVATAPEYRGKGALSELLSTTFEILRDQECPFVTLMPAYAGIYTPYGFSYCYFRHKYQLAPSQLQLLVSNKLSLEREDIADEAVQSILAQLYAALTATANAVPVRTAFQWRKLLTVHREEGTMCCMAYAQNEPVGYMLYKLEQGKLEIIELLAAAAEVRNALLQFAAVHKSEAQTITWLAPAEDKTYLHFADQSCAGSLWPFMMARCIDARRALSLLKNVPNVMSSGRLVLLLTDDFIERNNHLLELSWYDGRLQVRSTVEQENVAMDMAAFTQLFFGALSAQELFEEGRLRATSPEALLLLDQLLPKVRTYNNEYF